MNEKLLKEIKPIKDSPEESMIKMIASLTRVFLELNQEYVETAQESTEQKLIVTRNLLADNYNFLNEELQKN